MRENKKIIINAVLVVIGIALIVLSVLGIMNDVFCGFGGGLLAVGALRLFKAVKYKNNSEYKKKVDTATSDERNVFISTKAWSMAAYLFIIICVAITIVSLILSNTFYMQIATGAICTLLVLYCISYLIISRKY